MCAKLASMRVQTIQYIESIIDRVVNFLHTYDRYVIAF